MNEKKNNSQLGNSQDDILAALDACQAGETDAFARIIRLFQGRVYGLCLRFTGHPQDAEDAAAEVFIKTFHALASFDRKYKFSTWLYKIAVNHCIQTLRKKKREQNLVLGSDSHFNDHRQAADMNTPAILFFKEIDRETVRGILQTLPPKYRAALLLKYYEDLSYDEISDILEVPKNTVASFILRGKKILRKKLEEFSTRGAP